MRAELLSLSEIILFGMLFIFMLYNKIVRFKETPDMAVMYRPPRRRNKVTDCMENCLYCD